MDSRNNFKDIDVSTFDQVLAENMNAAELCPPGSNRKLRRLSGVNAAIITSIRHADYEAVRHPVPVIRLNPTDWASVQTRQRAGGEPIRNTAVVGSCTECGRPSSNLTPFWINCGTVIVQVDLCPACTAYAMDELGGHPQIGSDLTL